MSSDYLPILLQIVCAFGFAAVILVLSVVFGRAARRDDGAKDTVYECGVLPIGRGAPRFSIKFYLVAMLFVLFDIEAVFMYPWAVGFRDLLSQSIVPLLSMAGFAGLLGVAYVYVLRKGVLHWR
jgi:NADH-quinone oxidoreductase subunit A